MAASAVVQKICTVLYVGLLPIVLLAAAVVRFNALSFLYTILLLVLPLLKGPTPVSITSWTGIYLRVVFVVGLIGVLGHAAFHITLSAVATDAEPYGYMFQNCSGNEKLARQLGLEPIQDASAVTILRLVIPDVAVFLTGLLIYIICFKLLAHKKDKKPDELNVLFIRQLRSKRFSAFIQFISEFLIVLLLAACGIIVPSVLSSIYFLAFIFMFTLWSVYGSYGLKFRYYRIILMLYIGAHILVLHLYQFQFFQEILPPDDFIARLLGLTGVIHTSCDHPNKLYLTDSSQWPYFLNPGILLCLYFILAFELRRYLSKKDLVEETDAETEQTQRKSPRLRSNRSLERQVEAAPQDESQLEVGWKFQPADGTHLVESVEPPDYNSTGTTEPEGDRSGSASMLPVDFIPAGYNRRRRASHVRRKSFMKRSSLVSVMGFFMRQSYVLSLIAMMAWSITFHSWLTFVLLLYACIIWMTTKSRQICLTLSPFVLLYGVCLLLIQFVYGMNLKELPSVVNEVNLEDIGFKKFPYPCLQLALQVLFTSTFWLTFRQYVQEKRRALLAEGEKYQMDPLDQISNVSKASTTSMPEVFNFALGTDAVDGYDSNTIKWLGQYIWCLLCKYWIFVCAGMLLGISLQEVVVYRIIYMILFLCFILSFQLAYTFWRLTMFIFWWVVIIYSMAVLIILYTYQFPEFPGYWQNSTGLSIETLADLGLEHFDTTGLFIRLLTPTIFLIIIILQVHYFHKPFLALSALDRYKKETTEPDDSPDSPVLLTTDGRTTSESDNPDRPKIKMKTNFNDVFKKVWTAASSVWASISLFLWRLAEVHIFKLVALIIIVVAVHEVSAIGAVYIILLSVFLPLTLCHFLLSHIVQFWTAIVIIAKMIYQLRLVDNSNWLTNCTSPDIPPFNKTIDNALWVGMEKTDSISLSLKNYFAVLLLVALERIVRYHQQQKEGKPGAVKPRTGIIFASIKRANADEGIIECVKYFFNYFFYKFGLEMCYIMTAITICVRVDIFSVIYAIFLGLLLVLSRHGNATVWPIYTIILVILLPAQFLMCLGLPLGFCYEYLWDEVNLFPRALEKWLVLPDYDYSPDPHKLIPDFFQLLFVCLQWRVFRMEMGSSPENVPDGGLNTDIIPEVEARQPIPVEDFTTKILVYLDVLKNFVFTYMFWVTLAIVFIAGTNRINLFGMGYVIAGFCFMWFGQEFLVKPIRKLVRAWNFLIGYCYLVLLLKAAMQLPGCVYIDEIKDKACWLIQLLGLTCLKPAHTYITPVSCKVEADNTGLAWDVVCFVFLLAQRRIYTSHYFRHVVADFEAQNRLASRGAELINRILIKQVSKQRAEEKQILQNIKTKMHQLRDKQLSIKKTVEPEEHFQAIRSGDYYLFDESDDEEETDSDPEIDTLNFGTEEDPEGGLSPLQLISKAVHQGTDQALKDIEKQQEENKDSTSQTAACQTTESLTAMGEEEETSEEEEEEDSAPSKLFRFTQFLAALLISCSEWLTHLFNSISLNYRLVAAKLKDDHITAKKEIQAEAAVLKETHIEMETPPVTSGQSAEGDEHDASDKTTLVEVTMEKTKQESELSVVPSSSSIYDMDQLVQLGEDEQKFEEGQHPVYRLLVATYYLLIAKSELVCYFLMILNHIMAASLLSLPLPMFVFLWGMLSVPRPAKTFWITVITYTEAVVVCKYMFQFNFFFWNANTQLNPGPFWPPRILGIEQKDNFAYVDLVLLLALFIHRTILKRYGLWKDADGLSRDEEKAAASTEVVPSSSSIEETNVTTDGAAAKSEPLPPPEVPGTISYDSLDSTDSVQVKKEKPSPVKILLKPFVQFYKQLTCPDYNATTDVYAPMFACDFINFLIVVFGYQAFGPVQAGSEDVSSYISEDRVPIPFLIMLITQFILMIIDRALYLKKNVLGKFIFQILLVVLLHLWMFFFLPAITARSFANNTPAQLWYFIKCLYFGLSAYQIRSAYPTRILGNFLTKKYNYVNLFLYKGFLAIPFLLELRTVMDWMWTDTTMSISSWLQMEDIYANIYVLKCWRVIEKNHPTPRAMRKKAPIKYGIGGLLLFIIVFIIWFPLVIFSFANTVYVPNPPQGCTVTMSIEGYQPLFTVSGNQRDISSVSDGNFNQLKELHNKNSAAINFLNQYEAEDVSEILLNGNSTSLWGISPPSRTALINVLKSSKDDITMELAIVINRAPAPNSQAAEALTYQNKVVLSAEEKVNISRLIDGNMTQPVVIAGLFPGYMKLSSQAAYIITSLNSEFHEVVFKKEGNESREWWQVSMKNSYPRKISLQFYTFNQRVAPAGLSIITGYGIIGLYVSLVLVISRFTRTLFSNSSFRIMFEELPNVDKVMTLCLNFYMARESREYRLEEQLFSKLLFLYRSPETMIRYTKFKYD